MSELLDRLRHVLEATDGRWAVAVSGGVDSLTLGAVAHAALGPARVQMHHAMSPAVPAEATRRTKALAAARGWSLDIFDAGEFSDPAYRANPVNRCFFCKTNLYGTVVQRVGPGSIVVSGTNTDDLGEYRPGLEAARTHGVRHPFVEAGIDKTGVRAIARAVGLGEVAELPSSPCLSSRVETGIPIDPQKLATIDRIETLVRSAIAPRTVRCRVRASGMVVELDQAALDGLVGAAGEELRAILEANAGQALRFAAYRNGSAFLHAAAAQ
jgi:uncharacterized protein